MTVNNPALSNGKRDSIFRGFQATFFSLFYSIRLQLGERKATKRIHNMIIAHEILQMRPPAAFSSFKMNAIRSNLPFCHHQLSVFFLCSCIV